MKLLYSLIFVIFCSNAIGVIANEKPLSLKQRILMPGPLSENHAEFEADCEECHSSFDKKELSSNCLSCHEDIAKDRVDKSGFHGQSPTASTTQCQSCHGDHEGRNADILGLNTAVFEHAHTNFELTGFHKQLTCASCHEENTKFRDADPECFSCHKNDDRHKNSLGENCGTCHQTTRWQSTHTFDHEKTDFALHGKHKDLACMSCHLGEKYEFENTECVSCHLTSDVHAGSNGNQCNNCHNENDWGKIKFDHNDTDFALKGGHKALPCRACHSPTQFDKSDTPTHCIDCHKNDDPHFGRNGTECSDCHNVTRWDKILFDHNQDTDFGLSGKHQQLSCTQCHTGPLTEALPNDCASCHTADDVHKSESMKVCATCHNTSGWKTTSTFDHEFSRFPLIGMHAIVPCGTCHQDNHFATTSTACSDCHAEDDVHEASLGVKCESCHNPNGWGFWHFDHAKQTQFTLDGAHEGITCDACHKPKTSPERISSECVSCHAIDDAHHGAFGGDCSQCHTTHDFSELFWRDK